MQGVYLPYDIDDTVYYMERIGEIGGRPKYKIWKEICDRVLKERGNNMQTFNVTIDMETIGKKLELTIEKDGNKAFYDFPDGYDIKERYMLKDVATAIIDNIDCHCCVFKGNLKKEKDRYLVRYINETGIVNATCVEGESFAEVAERYKDYNVISIEKVAATQY